MLKGVPTNKGPKLVPSEALRAQATFRFWSIVWKVLRLAASHLK